nr:Multidrug resistance protein MdtM [Klebsiella pneumoniae]
MKLALGPYIRFSRILLFPLAMVIYDFSAYLTTDLIQPGIIHIIRELKVYAFCPQQEDIMFSYIMLGTNDLPRAIKFYDPLMALLGHVKAGRNEQGRPGAPSTAITPAGCA